MKSFLEWVNVRENLEKDAWGSMPKELQDKLNSNLNFVGTFHYNTNVSVRADSLKKAIQDSKEKTASCEVGCSYFVSYKDADTHVEVSNWHSGFEDDPDLLYNLGPARTVAKIKVTHKGQTFEWEE